MTPLQVVFKGDNGLNTMKLGNLSEQRSMGLIEFLELQWQSCDIQQETIFQNYYDRVIYLKKSDILYSLDRHIGEKQM